MMTDRNLNWNKMYTDYFNKLKYEMSNMQFVRWIMLCCSEYQSCKHFRIFIQIPKKEKTHMVNIKEWEKADLSIYLSFKIKSRLCINGRSPDSHFHSVIWEQGRPWVHWLTANKKLSTGIRWVTRARPGEPLVQSTVHCTLCTQGFKAEHGTWCRIMTWS